MDYSYSVYLISTNTPSGILFKKINPFNIDITSTKLFDCIGLEVHSNLPQDLDSYIYLIDLPSMSPPVWQSSPIIRTSIHTVLQANENVQSYNEYCNHSFCSKDNVKKIIMNYGINVSHFFSYELYWESLLLKKNLQDIPFFSICHWSFLDTSSSYYYSKSSNVSLESKFISYILNDTDKYVNELYNYFSYILTAIKNDTTPIISLSILLKFFEKCNIVIDKEFLKKCPHSVMSLFILSENDPFSISIPSISNDSEIVVSLHNPNVSLLTNEQQETLLELLQCEPYYSDNRYDELRKKIIL